MWFELAWNPGWQESLGPATSVPASVTSNLDGRLEVVAAEPTKSSVPQGGGVPVHSGGWVEHAWQTQPNNGWSNWERLPETSTSTSGPFAIQLGNHSLCVFLNVGGRLVENVQGPSGWSSGSVIATDPLAPTATPFAMQDRMGLTHVFVPGADATVRQIAQQPDSTWVQRSIPGVACPAQQLAGVRSSTQMALVGLGQDGMAHVALEHFSFPATMATLGRFDSGWSAISGETLLATPTGLADAFGGGHLFAVSSRGSLLHTRRSAPGPFPAWTEIAGPSERLVGRPAAALDANRRINVFVRKADGEILWVLGGAGLPLPLAPWSRSLLPTADAGSDPIVAANQDGRLELFATDVSTHAIKHIWQNITGIVVPPPPVATGDFAPMEGPIAHDGADTSQLGFKVTDDDQNVRIVSQANQQVFLYSRQAHSTTTQASSTVDVFFSLHKDRALLIDRGSQSALAISDLNSPSAKTLSSASLVSGAQEIWGFPQTTPTRAGVPGAPAENPDGRLFALHSSDDDSQQLKMTLGVFWSRPSHDGPLAASEDLGGTWQVGRVVNELKLDSPTELVVRRTASEPERRRQLSGTDAQ